MNNFKKIVATIAITVPFFLNFAMEINVGTFRAKNSRVAPETHGAGTIRLIITNNTQKDYVILVGNEQYAAIQPGQQNMEVSRPVSFLDTATLQNIPAHVNVSNLMVRDPESRHIRNLLQIAISRDPSDGTFGAFMLNTRNATNPVPLGNKVFRFDTGRPDSYTLHLILAGDNLEHSTLQATMEND